MPAPAPAHLISRAADPVFALLIGLGAAATRIHREEKEAGRGGWATIETGLRRSDTLPTGTPMCAASAPVDAARPGRNGSRLWWTALETLLSQLRVESWLPLLLRTSSRRIVQFLGFGS
ncbi:hypothetical protein B2J93_2563 [Marssonina coronariae]|uniref:Uncharacterized protein n=1 Tax=Diplocarpon coronariae TaxID=2795749 RepID=A0A218YZT3_9HELO|nr:hypothetical protein B2J93_2563 [Marssonina coronariae]